MQLAGSGGFLKRTIRAANKVVLSLDDTLRDRDKLQAKTVPLECIGQAMQCGSISKFLHVIAQSKVRVQELVGHPVVQRWVWRCIVHAQTLLCTGSGLSEIMVGDAC